MELYEVEAKDVIQVYSGVDGRCMCGCSGKHTYNPMYRDIASEEHGYEIDEDQCSLRTIKLILGKVKRASNVEQDGNIFYFATSGGERYVRNTRGFRRTPGRTYVVYLKPSDEELEANRRRRLLYKAEQAAKELAKKDEAQEALKGAGI